MAKPHQHIFVPITANTKVKATNKKVYVEIRIPCYVDNECKIVRVLKKTINIDAFNESIE